MKVLFVQLKTLQKKIIAAILSEDQKKTISIEKKFCQRKRLK